MASNKLFEAAAEILAGSKSSAKAMPAEKLAGEVADLFYHTLVALAHHQVDLKAVYLKLQERRK